MAHDLVPHRPDEIRALKLTGSNKGFFDFDGFLFADAAIAGEPDGFFEIVRNAHSAFLGERSAEESLCQDRMSGGATAPVMVSTTGRTCLAKAILR